MRNKVGRPTLDASWKRGEIKVGIEKGNEPERATHLLSTKCSFGFRSSVKNLENLSHLRQKNISRMRELDGERK